MSEQTLIDKIALIQLVVEELVNQQGQEKMEGDTGIELKVLERCC